MQALRALDVWVAALWWGGLTVVGFGVVPLLFVHLPTPAMAGTMAATLFSALNVLALLCGLCLLVFLKLNQPLALIHQARTAIFYVAFGMLIAVLLEWVVAPRIVARQDLRLWHSVGTLLYALQWVLTTLIFKNRVAARKSNGA